MKNIKLIEPKAEKIHTSLSTHNDERIDEYYWLKERDNPKVIDYLNAENSYRDKYMKDYQSLEKKLFEEIKSRIKEDDSSVPYFENGYFYYTRYETGKQYPIYCRKKENLDANEEILIDANKMSKGHDYFRIGGIDVSPNNKIAAYGVDTVSRRLYTIYFKNLETGEVYKDKIPYTTGSVTWTNDNSAIFYDKKDIETLREERVMKHSFGTNIKNDKEIYFEEDETFSVYSYKTKSNKYIVIASQSTLSDEYLIINANDHNKKYKIFQKREKGLEHSITHFNDKWYIRTNKDNATNFKLMVCDDKKTSKEYWKDFIPHREDVLLEDIDVFKNFFIVIERYNGLKRINIKPWNDSKNHYIDFETETYSLYSSYNPNINTNKLRYNFSSLTTPSSVIEYDMITREKKVLKENEVLGEFNKDNYTSKRVWANARDGKKVPISLVYRKDKYIEGSNPLLLYAYGSYGITNNPNFSSVRLSLLDRGFIYAIAHIRGSQYLGREWYDDGKMFNKKNTFTDFIDCGKFLIKSKFADKNKLFAMGGSAGGLLMGAVSNMAPELFKGIVAAVPFVDVITTMLDEDIPLTTSEYDEWGNPNNKDSYDYMLSYSPYDQVEKKDYPAIFITAGYHDSQVQYFEPAKWIARLRDRRTNKEPLLMYCNMEAGHGGASGRFEAYKETAMEYSFLLALLDD
jgi:oligopeptidase B